MATKQIGDRVRIIAGQQKGQIGNIVGKENRAWQIELDGGDRIKVNFPHVTAIEPDGVVETPATKINLTSITDEEQSPSVESLPDEPATNLVDRHIDEIGPNGEVTLNFRLEGTKVVGGCTSDEDNSSNTATVENHGNTDNETELDHEPETNTSDDATPMKNKRSSKRNMSIENLDLSNLSKLTVVQLQAVAISKGIAIARTKGDFLKIIEEKQPDIDMSSLKGSALFDTVSQLHISRLRSKADLITLLQS